MAERDLKVAILKRFTAMKRQERIAAVRKLASESVADKAFVRDFFSCPLSGSLSSIAEHQFEF